MEHGSHTHGPRSASASAACRVPWVTTAPALLQKVDDTLTVFHSPHVRRRRAPPPRRRRCPRGPPPHTGFSSWPSTSTFRVRVRPLHRRLERRGHHGYHPRRWHLRAAARCACPTTSSRSATTRRTGRALWGDGEKFEVTRNEAARACAWGDCIREETAEQRSTGCGWPEWEAEASPIQL
jgi:hypothetical protein